MSIVKEFFKTKKDGIKMYRIYSDEGYEIRKINTDEIYAEVVNSENAIHEYEYEETTKKIKTPEELLDPELEVISED